MVIALTFILLLYFAEVAKSPEELSYYRLGGLLILAVICTGIRELCKEWCIDNVGSVFGAVNRNLRGLFFSKMMTVNSTFLNTADESIVRKVETYELSTIINFMCSYHKIYNFPILAIVSLGLMIYFISTVTVVVVLVFIFLTITLYLLSIKTSRLNLVYEFSACQRSLVVDEILDKLHHIKNEGMEDFFQKKIKKIRKTETSTIGSLFVLRALSNTLISMLPTLCILVILVVEVLIMGQSLSVANIFTIVSVVSNFYGPLTDLIYILDMY